MRRALAVGVVVVLAVGAAIAVAGHRQRHGRRPTAAAAGCSNPAAVAVAVQHKRIRSTVSARGTAAQAISAPIEIDTSSLAPSDVVTAAMSVGQEVRPGDQVLRVGERPVFAIAGTLPAYRDLRLHDVGPDVVALQATLAAAGLPVAGRSGVLGPSTARAVQTLYQRVGAVSPEALSRGAAPAPAADATAPGAPVEQPVVLPRGEYFTTPTLPATVTAAEARVGVHLGAVGPKAFVLGSGRTLVRVAVPDGVGRSVVVGATAWVDPTDADAGVAAQVAGVGHAAVDDGHGSLLRRLIVETQRPITVGDHLVRVVVADSLRPGWVVPLSAVVGGADGTAQIRIARVGTRAGPWCRQPPSRLLSVRVAVTTDGEALVIPARYLDLARRLVVAAV